MNAVNHEAAQSALDHIETLERCLKLLRQYINPQVGVINDMQAVAKLVNCAGDEMVNLRANIVRFL